MAAKCYQVWNCAAPTTAAPVKQPTGSAIRTMMQLRFATGYHARLIAFGYAFDGSAAAAPGQIEVFETTVAATMSTAYAAADVFAFNDPNATAQSAGASGVPLNLSTSTSGFATGAVTEGTVANYRGFYNSMTAPTNEFHYQWPLGREPEIVPQNYLRVRVTFAATVNIGIYIIFEG